MAITIFFFTSPQGGAYTVRILPLTPRKAGIVTMLYKQAPEVPHKRILWYTKQSQANLEDSVESSQKQRMGLETMPGLQIQ